MFLFKLHNPYCAILRGSTGKPTTGRFPKYQPFSGAPQRTAYACGWRAHWPAYRADYEVNSCMSITTFYFILSCLFQAFVFVESPQPVATFFHCWLELISLQDVGSDFVVHLAAKGASNDKGFLTNDRTVGALQGAQKKDRSFSIPKDEERLDIYSSTSTAFYQYPLLFLELLSSMSNSNSVVREIYLLFQKRIETRHHHSRNVSPCLLHHLTKHFCHFQKAEMSLIG